MVQESFKINTRQGDVYNLKLSSFDDSFFSKEIYERISPINIVNIDLTRAKGSHPTSLRTLTQIVQDIANIFLSRHDIIICYYCDFLSPIPHTSKQITCQEYRSRLFSLLYNRFLSKFNIKGIREEVITIHGEEDYYVHLIYRNEHQNLVDIISSDIHEGYDKPQKL